TDTRPKAGAHVRARGEDIQDGQCLVPRGATLGPGEIANLLTQGVLESEVVRQPTVAFLSTGDELVPPGPEPKFGQVTNSSVPMLAAAARRWGAKTQEHPPLPDRLERITEGFLAAARGVDLLVVTGGMSVGDYDFAARAMSEIGGVSFHSVRMKPGKPLAFGRIEGTPVLGLPGNPVSSYVGFELFGRPAIRALGGHADVHRPRTTLRLGEEVKRLRSRPNYLRGRIDGDVFTPHRRQGSGDLSSVLGVDALGIIEQGEGQLAKGDRISALDLRRE
ncbi:MAG: molybdopterin molybdotransferase MoeA, partial [Myxococcota bacterium]